MPNKLGPVQSIVQYMFHYDLSSYDLYNTSSAFTISPKTILNPKCQPVHKNHSKVDVLSPGIHHIVHSSSSSVVSV